MREQLDVLTEQWKRDKEARKCGWVMKKATRWRFQQLISRRQRHMLKVWIKEVDKIKVDDREVCICEPEQGPILGKGDDEKRPIEGLMDSKDILDQHVEVLTEELSEAIEPHVFKTDKLYSTPRMCPSYIMNRNHVLYIGESSVDKLVGLCVY